MKTAIIKTDFWKSDDIFELSIDARMLYLCILTNPDRNGTPAIKLSNRLLSHYTGFNATQIELSKKSLIEKGLINIIDDYIIINSQDFVEPKTGKLSKSLYEKDFNNLPENIREFLLSGSSGSLECIGISSSIGISKGISISNDIDNKQENKDISYVINLFGVLDINLEHSDWQKLKSNSKLKEAIRTLLKTKSVQEIEERLEIIKGYNQLQFLSSFDKIYTPIDLLRNWTKVEDKGRALLKDKNVITRV